jgi:hypothetical protein
MDRKQYNTWVADFAMRYPAMGDYVKRRPLNDQKVLHDTWFRTLEPYMEETLRAVTDSIIKGKLQPVANVDLGQFGEQIRNRCRELLDQERSLRKRRDLLDQASRGAVDPLKDGNNRWMYCCLQAAIQIRWEDDKSQEIEVKVSPWNWSGAVVILADNPKPNDREVALKTLESEGMRWEDIVERAKVINPARLFQTV